MPTSILDAIPAERLALLDMAMLYHGSHQPGGPDCRHCARELLHEVVTGEHADKTPPGVTAFVAILPGLNDAPGWRDDAHRTLTLRPYLKRFLELDPAHDTERVYALVDHAYRKVLPNLCDALQLPDEAAKLRALALIVDAQSVQAAITRARTLDLTLDLDLTRTLAPTLAIDLTRALDRARAPDRALAPEDRAKAWEQAVREVLDLVCGIA